MESVREVKLCDECIDEYEFGLLCRTYLRLQRLRMSIEGTLRHVRPETKIYEILSYYHNLTYNDEKQFLETVKPMLEAQPLWQWCSIVKGMGHVSALTFHAFIRTHVHVNGDRIEIDTAGKARKYFGLYPGAQLKAGRRGGFNPQAKGRILGVIVKGILMAGPRHARGRERGDPYYRALYEAKKEYYAENSRYAPALKDPTLCPKYAQCFEKYKQKAERLGRKPKKPTCKGHINNMAIRWLGGILASHATQLIREGKGLDVTNFKAHRAYIPPKSHPDEMPNPNVLEKIRTGKLE